MSKEKKFEENLADLEVIVQKLEHGDVALEEAIAEFQTAQKRKWNDKKRETGKNWSDD